MDDYNNSKKRDFSREDLVKSCFGKTMEDAFSQIMDYKHEFEEFYMLRENEDFVKKRFEEYKALSCFFGKALNFIKYNKSGLPARDDYEKSLLEELRDEII